MANSDKSPSPDKRWKSYRGSCQVCNVYFVREKYDSKKGEPRFCSKKCAEEAKQKGMMDFVGPKRRDKVPLGVTNQELARRMLARRRLLYFTQQTYPTYQTGWVHDDICRRLERFSEQVRAKKSPRLMLLMPPRHGKSELASIRFPAWHLGHAPEHEIINVAYNLDLPMKFSRKVRELLRDPVYNAIFPATVLNPDSQSVETWSTMKGGGFLAAGVGGGITGKGAHCLIIDDPIKNQADADSILVRDSLWEWYMSTAYTRLAPGGGVLLIETWWNDDDLAGRLQQLAQSEEQADQFEIVKYPAIAEYDEYRHPTTLDIQRLDPDKPEQVPGPEYLPLRKKGQALHEDRYPAEALLKMKASLTKRIWSALYQQNPVPDEGAYFTKDQFKYEPTSPPPVGKYIYTAWDFAISEKQTADWTVGVTVLQDEHDVLHVVDLTRIKADAFVIVEEILNTAARWGNHNVPYLVGVEDGQIFRALATLLKRRMQERNVFPALELLKPFTDKLARARPLQGRMQSGRVLFPSDKVWVPSVVNEMLRFPAGVHDDCVDALAWCAQLTLTHQPPPKFVPPPMASWKDKLESFMMGLGKGSHMAS